MKRGLVLLLIVTVVLGFSGAANAFFGKIGTASYDGNNDGSYETYNLVYEGDLGGQGLLWLDYTRGKDTWYNQVAWASGLGIGLIVTLDPGYTSPMQMNIGWRLPSTDESRANLSGVKGYAGPDQSGYHNYTWGYNMVNSEMGHLYYMSLGNKGYQATDGTEPQANWGFVNRGAFNNLPADDFYWSDTTVSFDRYPEFAWLFRFDRGYQDYSSGTSKGGYYYAVAVRPTEISVVPIPAAMWLFSSGLISLMEFRRKFRKR